MLRGLLIFGVYFLAEYTFAQSPPLRCKNTLRTIGFFQNSSEARSSSTSPTYEILAFDRVGLKKSDSLVLISTNGPTNGSEFFSAVTAIHLSDSEGSRKIFTDTETGESLTTRMRSGQQAELQRSTSSSHRMNLLTEGLEDQRLNIMEMDLSTATPLLFPAEWLHSKEPLENTFTLISPDKGKSPFLEVEIYRRRDSSKALILITQKFKRVLRSPASVREFLVADVILNEKNLVIIDSQSKDYFLRIRISNTANLIFIPKAKTETNLVIPAEGLDLAIAP